MSDNLEWWKESHKKHCGEEVEFTKRRVGDFVVVTCSGCKSNIGYQEEKIEDEH